MRTPPSTLDLPWNPAILEQRIGRIYRMGQKHPVNVINFVSKGTIEEGMLSVLAFKRSLSEGILDGGNTEISLGGSRLNRFMRDVENVTGKMGTSEAVAPAEEMTLSVDAVSAAPLEEEDDDLDLSEAAVRGTRINRAGAEPRNTGTDPWQALAQIGVQFVAALATANNPDAPIHPWIERNDATGAQSLKLPLPSPEIAGQLANAFAVLAETLRGETR